MQESCPFGTLDIFALQTTKWPFLTRSEQHQINRGTYKTKRQTTTSAVFVSLPPGVLGPGSSHPYCRYCHAVSRLLYSPQNWVIRRGRPVFCGHPGHQLQQGAAPQRHSRDRALLPRVCYGCNGGCCLDSSQSQLERKVVSQTRGRGMEGGVGIKVEGI